MISDASRTFAWHLHALRAGSDSVRALGCLRRSLRHETGIAPEAMHYVERWIPEGASDHVSRMYYLVGGLFSINPRQVEHGSLGDLFAQIMADAPEGKISGGNASGDKMYERRFSHILDRSSDVDAMREPLMHAMGLADQRKIGLNYGRLLDDLLAWDDDVRRRLVRECYDGHAALLEARVANAEEKLAKVTGGRPRKTHDTPDGDLIERAAVKLGSKKAIAEALGVDAALLSRPKLSKANREKIQAILGEDV